MTRYFFFSVVLLALSACQLSMQKSSSSFVYNTGIYGDTTRMESGTYYLKNGNISQQLHIRWVNDSTILAHLQVKNKNGTSVKRFPMRSTEAAQRMQLTVAAQLLSAKQFHIHQIVPSALTEGERLVLTISDNKQFACIDEVSTFEGFMPFLAGKPMDKIR